MEIMKIYWFLVFFCFESLAQEPILGTQMEGKASYYGVRFHGKTTANGEKMDKYAMTCAHKTLPFGTMIEVENPRNNKRVVVRVNDRGPYSGARIIDLSLAAAEKLGMIRKGVVIVKATIVGKNGEVFISRPSAVVEILNDDNPLPLIEIPIDKKTLERKRTERKNE